MNGEILQYSQLSSHQIEMTNRERGLIRGDAKLEQLPIKLEDALTHVSQVLKHQGVIVGADQFHRKIAVELSQLGHGLCDIVVSAGLIGRTAMATCRTFRDSAGSKSQLVWRVMREDKSGTFDPLDRRIARRMREMMYRSMERSVVMRIQNESGKQAVIAVTDSSPFYANDVDYRVFTMKDLRLSSRGAKSNRVSVQPLP